LKWSKLGKIFEAPLQAVPNGFSEFAQSPQTLIKSDRVRVYFSTRQRDRVGKYLSRIAFVDFDKTMRNIVGGSNHTVIELGGLGCFDEHGIFPINVLRDGDRVLAYTTGWNRKVSVSADTSIGLAISRDDGLTFQKYGNGPVLSASLNEPFLVADAYVSLYGGLYHMWYIYGTKWKKFAASEPPERIYKIAHATSKDGIRWNRDGRQIIADQLNADECQALPTVFRLNGIYHMYFCYRQAHSFREQSDHGYRIGYAYSDDLIHWERADRQAGIDVSEDGWDSKMQCYPHVFQLDEKTYMLYNGNEFGRFGFGLALLDEE
jgi:predicted GH43/DUF377 family glycosyl hydrolase